ncbi:MAG: TldD/PmbA family protein, partial [bacterium]
VHREMAAVSGIFLTEGGMSFWKKDQYFGSSQGGFVSQTILESGAESACFALKDTDLQRRSYPSYHGGNVAAAGYEFIRELNLVAHAHELAEEAVALLTAESCPEKETTLVIGSSQLALQVHESVGHPAELDRIFGTEISFAGGSWVRPQDVGSLKYGSPLMNIVCDATLPRGLGTAGFDDEGVPAQRYHMVKEGTLRNALSSRESAAKIGKRSTGAMRADGWNRIPLVRMTNVSLEAGNLPLDQLLADIDDGIFMETNKSWSIDDRRLNFQFATEYAREISHGKIGRLLKNPIYQGMTPVFWGSLDGVGDSSTWRLWGIPTCGKGQPMQTAHVSHGAPVGRFRNVKVRPSK